MENQEVSPEVNPFAEESWSDAPVKNDVQDNVQEEVQVQSEPQETEQEVEQEESPSQPSFKYENELSERIHKALVDGKHDEVYTYLEQKNRLDKLSSAEIKDRSIAEDIVKTHLKLKYTDLTDDEINYKFNRQYKLPKEPVQDLTESDEEFQEKMDEYNQKIQDINTELLIEAKTVRPDLVKQQSEIKLPSLGNNKDPKSPEDLANQEAYVESYFRNAESTINEFTGLNVEYKDESASFVSSYVPSIEEKQEVANLMDDLASSEFDANALFAERWVNDDYSLNTKKIAEDIWFFQNKDKIVQKLVNDAVSKRITEYRKQTSNINVNNGNQANFNPSGEKSEIDRMADHFFSN